MGRGSSFRVVRTRLLVVQLSVAAVALVAACSTGGSSSGGDTTTSSSTSTTSTTLAEPIGATQISTGDEYACALMTGGGVKCWGDNNNGQLGIGTDGLHANSTVPVDVSSITDATQISSGPADVCALLSGGTVKCWGDNTYGELGNGTTTGSDLPQNVSGLTGATQVVTGTTTSCALVAGGVVKCWGANGANGYLGNGGQNDSYVPVTVSGISGATQITTSCALLAGGTVKCWGPGSQGQLGNGTMPTYGSNVPVSVSNLTGATQISGLYGGTCALLASGTVKCWGSNFYGELGNGTTTNSSVPVSVSNLSGATAISRTENESSCALVAGGAIECWGNNVDGELGNGTTTNSDVPVNVSGLTTAIQVSAGDYSTCALFGNGTAQCWGDNLYGGLGNGTYVPSDVPVNVTGIG
jgi:alpha-tubulin suppressor-like RCC1 family protein